jgi:LacI family transcriptional regulator
MTVRTAGIKEVARLAGVSTGTVDRVLHNRGKVSNEAREKVLAVLQKINYKPNFIARNLGSNKIHRIATLIPGSAIDEYWYQCQKGINSAANDWSHFNIVIEPYLFDLHEKSSFDKVADEVLKAKPDGILMAPLFHAEAVRYLDLFNIKQIPYVLFNTEIQNSNSLSFIGQNSFQSGRLAAELLHLHSELTASSLFAIVHVDEDLSNSAHLLEKEKGFREYFKEVDRAEVLTLSVGQPQSDKFKNDLHDLLENTSLKGIFVSTSKAFEVAMYMDDYKIPKVKIVGYDLLSKNLYFLKRGLIDFLIHQNPKRQAFQGISTLANYLIFNKEAKEKNLFPLEIITRENLSSYLNSDTF